MAKTMIQIDTKTRDKIKELGDMGETYDDVLQRMYLETVANIQARVFLDTHDTVSIEDILRERKITV